MAPYKVPKIIEFIDAIPLTAVGKVDKKGTAVTTCPYRAIMGKYLERLIKIEQVAQDGGPLLCPVIKHGHEFGKSFSLLKMGDLLPACVLMHSES